MHLSAWPEVISATRLPAWQLASPGIDTSVTRLGYFCTLGNNSKPVATIILPKLPTLLGNFCKGVKIIHFSSEIIFGQLYRHLVIFIWSHCLIPTRSISPEFVEKVHLAERLIKPDTPELP